jgi:hypothetical protein
MMRPTAVAGSSACTKVEVALRSGRAEVRHRALIDAMSIGDDPLCAACRNTSVSRTTGTTPDEMMSAST